MNIAVPATVLVPNRWGYSFNAYLDDYLAIVPPTEKTTGFEQFLTDKSLGIVIWPERVAADPLFTDDAEFASFIGNLANYSFITVPVPKSRGELTVLVRQDLLDPGYRTGIQSDAASTSAASAPSPASNPQTDRNAQLAQAEVLAAAGQFDEATGILRSLVDAMPSDRNGQMALARALVASGANSEAITQYRLINERWPDFPWAYVQLGQLLFKLGETNEGIALLKKAVQVAPDQADTHFVLGGMYKRTGQREAAIAQFQRGLAIDPTRAAAQRDLEELMAAPKEP
jgi:tetratricopeptide (TPR) repeat protein